MSSQLRHRYGENALFDTLHELMTTLDLDLRIQWANQKAANLANEDPENLVGRYCYQVWQGKGSPCENCPTRKVIQTGEPKESDVKTPDGRYWHLKSYPLRSQEGNLERVAEIGLDITEQKQTEEKLRKKTELLNKTQQIAQVGSWELDLVANTLTWSDEVFRIFGLEPQDYALTYEDFLDFVHPDDRSMVDSAYTNSLIGGKDIYEVEHRILRKNTNEVRYVHEKCYHERNSEGVVIRSIGMIQDITDRKQTEQALRTSKRNLSQTLFSIGDAVITTDATGCITSLNPVAEELTAWSQSQAQGRLLTDVFRIVHAESREPSEDPVQKVLANGEIQGLANHTVLLAQNGKEYHIADSASPIRDEEGNISGVVLVFRNVTEEYTTNQLTEKRLELVEYAASHTLDELLTKVLDEVGEFVNSPLGFYHFVDADQNTLTLEQFSTRTVRNACSSELKDRHYSIEQSGVWGDCVRKMRPVIHNDYGSLPHRTGLPPGHPDIVRQLVTPVVREKKIVALLGVGNKPSNYTNQDQEIVSFFADVTWGIVARKLSEERNRHLNRMLSAVRKVNQLITQEKDFHRLIQGACETLIASGGYDGAWIALFDEWDELEAAVEAGWGEEFRILRERLERGELPSCLRSSLNKTGIKIARDHPSECGDCPLATPASGNAKMCVRLEHNETVYGVLTVSLPVQFSTQEEEQELLREVGNDLAFALHNIQMEEQRQKDESEREITLRMLHLLHRFHSVSQLISEVTRLLQEWSHCEAVGVRLQEGDDFPYYQTLGFSRRHVHLENRLCKVDANGETVRDPQGNPVLECMCGKVIRGHGDPSQPQFTQYGSFWTNSISDRLASLGEEVRQAGARRYTCPNEGYESAALIPLRHGDETLGLIQFNDPRRNRFDVSQIRLFERLAQNLALGLMQRQTADKLREREHLFRQLYEQATMGIFVVDESHRILDVNPMALSLLGYGREEILQLNEHDLVHPDDTEQVSLRATQEQMLRGETVRMERRFRTKDRSFIHVLVSIGRLNYYSAHASHMIMFQDITDRKQAEEALRRSEDYYRAIFETSGTAMFIIEEDTTISLANSNFEELSGYSRQQIEGEKSWTDFAHSDDVGWMRENHYLRRRNPDAAPRQYEFRFMTRGGEQRDILLAVDMIPGTNRSIASAIDITERKEIEEKLKEMSLYDSLTGLYNRNFFEEEMNRLSDRRHSPVGIVVCDLDGLKFVNDTLGHQSGDQMLTNTADILRRNFRCSDIIARIGGDEFAILLTQTTPETMERILWKLRRSVQDYNNANPEIPLSMSFGHAVDEGPTPTMHALFREADNRMYREKIQREGSARSAILQALTGSMQARDFNTEGHCDRLQDLAASLARSLNLSQDFITDLFLLARFHDLGKVGIPDHILFKNDLLTEEEWQQMHKHCEIGHRIASSVPDLEPIADFILKHHEQWDGQGYPLGLSGRDIPLPCRILAIVDAYDAMTSDRPYRRAMTSEEANAELRRCAGTQFDPELVEKFINLVNDQYKGEP